jgi:hypothetical protein
LPTFLQPAELPERCYLEEVLYWVAFQRLPVAGYNYDGQEIRQSDEMGYAPGIVETELADEETKRAGIPHLGHEHVLTTFCSYGDVSSYRQTQIMRSFAGSAVAPSGIAPQPVLVLRVLRPPKGITGYVNGGLFATNIGGRTSVANLIGRSPKSRERSHLCWVRRTRAVS